MPVRQWNRDRCSDWLRSQHRVLRGLATIVWNCRGQRDRVGDPISHGAARDCHVVGNIRPGQIDPTAEKQVAGESAHSGFGIGSIPPPFAESQAQGDGNRANQSRCHWRGQRENRDLFEPSESADPDGLIPTGHIAIAELESTPILYDVQKAPRAAF
jgi:hypothetical protein